MSFARHRTLTPRAAAVCAALIIWLTCGYFQNSRPGWNVNSQFALACALGERGTLRIEPYLKQPQFETGDFAVVQGRIYSDKSPVIGFLAAPIVWAARQWALATTHPLNYDRLRWLVTWLVIGGAAGLLAAAWTLLLARRGVAPAWAGCAAVAGVACTPLLGYAILFYNYLPALALGMWGWYWHERSLEGPPLRALFIAGACCGLATWTLNTLALFPLLLTLALIKLVLSRRLDGRATLAWVGGGLLGGMGQLIYTRLVFGTFGSPYQFEADTFFREQMARGLMGATQPSALVAWLVTFHPYKGLFFWWPLALLALLGTLTQALHYSRTRASTLRLYACCALGIFGLLLLYNSAYFMWWGGWAYAPRHLLPTLAPLALGLAACLRHRVGKLLFGFVALPSLIVNVSMVALDPQFPPQLPQEQLLAPHTVPRWPVPQLEQLAYVWRGWQTDHNLGTALGLSGPVSLLPLLIGLALASGWLFLRQPANQIPDARQN